MYFHLIGIKEKNGTQYELDLLIGGDEELIRNFLAHRGVVVVSLEQFKDDPNTFGNVFVYTVYNNTEIQILLSGEDLRERLYFLIYLGLDVKNANFINNPIPEQQANEIIATCVSEIKEENEKIKKEQEEGLLKEQKKYEESGIKDALKVVNANIERIEQIVKAGNGILSSTELKDLESYSNEMKKIRLGTNFNKMASLVLESHRLENKAEEKIIETYKSENFLINNNTFMTNIDVIQGCYYFNRSYEKSVFMPKALTATEMVSTALGSNSVILKLLLQDIISTFQNTNFDEFFEILMNLVEYFVLIMTIIFCIAWLIAPLLGINGLSLYFLPAFGWLGLLVYLFNSLNLKGFKLKVIGILVLIGLFRSGLVLLLGTFAL